MKTLKLSKDDTLVRSKWRRLIRGTGRIVMTVEVNVSNCSGIKKL